MDANSAASASREDQIDAAIADYLDAVQGGAVLDDEGFLQSHPDIAIELREFLDDRQAFTSLASSLAPAAIDSTRVSLKATLAPDAVDSLGDDDTTFDSMPRQFGEYLLLQEIARGGMGVIYKARQTALNRTVAVKLILEGRLASAGVVERFHVEAQAAAKLTHPNIVAIHDVGLCDGQHYFSMDFVDGASLAERLSYQTFPVSTAVEYVMTIAEALHYAHQQGVLHRDVKPSNILIDTSGRPRITDFGLAKQIVEDQRLTATGQILGTPSYMPPEQASGDYTKYGPTSDVYSLGAVLYEMLTGRPPFVGESAVDTILQARQREVVSPRLINPSVSRDLETICLKCLDKDPARRYPSAAALAADLRRFQSDEPITARPISSLGRTWRWCRRNPVVAQLLCVLTIAVVAVSFQWARAEYFRFQQHDATLRAQNATTAERHAKFRAQANADAARIARQQAYNQARLAGEQAHAAELAREGERRNLYLAQMNLASQAIAEGNFRRAVELIREYSNCDYRSDPRGFDWYYLWRQAHQQGTLAVRHGGQLRAVAVTGDNKYLITGGSDRAIRVWRIEDGRLLVVFTGHTSTVSQLVVTLDGSRLLSGSSDHTTCLWNLELALSKAATIVAADDDSVSTPALPVLVNQPMAAMPTANESDVQAFSVDGRLIATCDQQNVLRVVDANTGQISATMRGHLRRVIDVAFSPDNRWLASTDLDRTVRLWNVATGESLFIIKKEKQQSSYGVAFSPDGKQLAVGTSDEGGSIELYAVESGEMLSRIEGYEGSVDVVAYSPDGKHIAGGARDQTLRVWDVETGRPVSVFRGQAGYVRAIYFMPDGSGIVAGSDDGAARLWSFEDTHSMGASVTSVNRSMLSVAWSPDGKTIASGSYGHGVYLVDAASGKIRSSLYGHTGAVYSVGYSPDGTMLASASRDQTVRLWNANNGQCLETFEDHHADVRCVAFSQDGKMLASGDRDGLLIIRDVATGKVLRTIQHMNESNQPQTVYDIAFTPDGTGIVSNSRFTALWDLETGERRQLGNRWTSGFGVAISPDGTWVAASDQREYVHLWNLTNRQRFVLSGHSGRVEAIEFCPDGQTIATASRDKKIILWDVATGRQRATLSGHTDNVTCLKFSPDGMTLASGSRDQTVRFWRRASANDVMAWYESTLARPSSPSQVFNLQNQQVESTNVELTEMRAEAVEQVVKSIGQLGGRVVTDSHTPNEPVLRVYLTGSQVNDETLSMLSQFTKLKVLSLFNTYVTGAGLAALKECKELETLTLMGSAITDDLVSQVRTFPNLRTLTLGKGIPSEASDDVSVANQSGSITDESLVHFAALQQLHTLAFDNTQITDDGLIHLATLKGLRQLQFFRTPNVTSAGLERLKRLLPDCEMGAYDFAEEVQPAK